MKKLRLRKEVKNILVGVAVVAALAALFIYAADRNERINNGDLVVISESNME